MSNFIKQYLLLNDTELLKAVSKASYKQFCDNELINNGVIHKDKWHDLESALSFEDIIANVGYLRFKNAIEINHSNATRKTRLRKRIDIIIKDALNRGLKVYFVTFTFSPELIDITTDKTRKTYIQRTMKSTCIHYVGNIDFGVDERYTQREHYHAVVSCENIQALIDTYKNMTNSRIFIETIKLYANYTKTNHKLAKYISKLSNHAVKESATKRVCYIFDRNKEYLL